MCNIEDYEAYLEKTKKALINPRNKQKVTLESEWIKALPSEPGTYVIFESGELVYVGETGNIRGRIKDMRDTRHHTLRRNVGSVNFSNTPGYKRASSKKKFPKDIECKVEEWFKSKFEVSVLPLKLGRKELEEKICKEHEPKYNQKGQRQAR